jgi:hypothetical protein
MASATACTDRGSDITIAYRGDVAAYRPLVHVRYDIEDGARRSGDTARVVVPDFPSAARPRPIASHGTMRAVVTAATAPGAPLARYSPPPIQLATKTSYLVNIIISPRHPAETRCSGRWVATPIASSAGESLYVSVVLAERAAEPPRCDD